MVTTKVDVTYIYYWHKSSQKWAENLYPPTKGLIFYPLLGSLCILRILKTTTSTTKESPFHIPSDTCVKATQYLFHPDILLNGRSHIKVGREKTVLQLWPPEAIPLENPPKKCWSK